MPTSFCEDCGQPARQGPRGGFRPYCPLCERDRRVAKTRRVVPR